MSKILWLIGGIVLGVVGLAWYKGRGVNAYWKHRDGQPSYLDDELHAVQREEPE